MRQIPNSLSAALLMGYIVAAVSVAGGEGSEVPWHRYDYQHLAGPCQGFYSDRELLYDVLGSIFSKHVEWLEIGPQNPRDTRKANLCKARLGGLALRGVNLNRADLREADLTSTDLKNATLMEADLSKSRLTRTVLYNADLSGTNLQGADLRGADLRKAYLIGTELQGANLGGAQLAKAIYEPDPESLPVIGSLALPTTGLEELQFFYSPAGLLALREALKKAGLRTQESQITYAIRHTKRLQMWKKGDLPDKSESLFNLVAFELPCDYGMSPGRPLKILGGSIGLFALLYMVALFTARGDSGIWMVWLSDRVHKSESEANPTRVTSTFLFSPLKMWAAGRWQRGLARGLSVLLIGLYFSLLSAFSLGWRELNVGTWIARVQPREYTLRATGWVRTVSGLQSLLSVYLLALWVLTYFGRPFE